MPVKSLGLPVILDNTSENAPSLRVVVEVVPYIGAASAPTAIQAFRTR
ncbi:hypothetical protein [Synechococcus sp. M16CYN]